MQTNLFFMSSMYIFPDPGPWKYTGTSPQNTYRVFINFICIIYYIDRFYSNLVQTYFFCYTLDKLVG